VRQRMLSIHIGVVVTQLRAQFQLVANGPRLRCKRLYDVILSLTATCKISRFELIRAEDWNAPLQD
jgi:hypothetical protein